MAARYVLAFGAVLILALAVVNLARGRGAGHPQTRTWLLVGGIFALVCAWLIMRT